MSAGNIKLNLKEFKHVSSDKDSTTLKHKKGHKLVLAHNSLSPESQEQLKALAKGGNPKLEESKKTPPKPHYDDGGIVDTVQKYLAPDFYNASHPNQDHPPAYPTQSKAKGGKVYMQSGGEAPHWDQEHAPPPADPHTPPPAQTVTHKKQTTQAEDYKAQDDYDAQQKASRSQWDPSYAEGGGVSKHDHEKTPYDQHLPCLNPNCKSNGKPHPNCMCYGGMAEGGKPDNLRYCAHGMPHKPGCEYSQQDMSNAKEEASGRAEMERTVKPKMKGLKDGGSPEDAPVMQDAERDFHHQYIEPDKEESQDEQNKGIDKEIEDASSFANPDDQQAQSAPLSPEDQGLSAQRNARGQEIQPSPQQPAPDASGYQPLPGAPNTMQQQGNYNASKDANPVQRFQNAAQYYDYKKNEVINQGIQEGDAWMKDLQDGHIKPETYQSLFHNKDTTGKIGTLFGLLVSGAGSGLAHQSNAVMDMMKQTIDNDLQAQIHSKQDAVNYLRLGQQHEMNKAQIGNINQETNAKAIANAKTMMNWSMFHQQMQNIQAMPEGKAKQDALSQMAVMNQAIQNDNYDIWSRMGSAAAAAHVMGMTGASNGQGSEAAFQQRNKLMGSGMMGDVGKNIATNEAARHIPGIQGNASRDVTSGDLSKLQAHQVMDTKIRDLMKYAQDNRGSVDPKVWAQAKQKAEETTAFYNNSLDGLGMTQGRMNWLDEQIKKNPTSIIGQVLGNNKRLQEIRDSNVMRRDQFLSGPGGLGFPKQAPQSKSGRQIEYRNGKAYYKK